MLLRTVTLTALCLAAALPGAAAADDAAPAEQSWSVWVDAHVERRETRRVIPAETREVWVPERVEVRVIPAVTERVRLPAVVERVWCAAVVERCWVPEVRERTYVGGHSEERRDAHGCRYTVWIAGHYEDRVVCAGRYEDRCVRAGRWEDRVVSPERFEDRIVTPERRETRVIEAGHKETIVVRRERVEVTVEHVWVPGRWDTRSATPRT